MFYDKNTFNWPVSNFIMPQYLARYTVWANMFDGGALMPDPEPHKPEYKFQAKNDKEAKKIAELHMTTFQTKYFGPDSKIDEILKIEEIN